MPFVPVPDVVRVAIEYTDTGGSQAVNILHCKYTDPPVTVAAMNDLLDNIEGWLTAFWDLIATNQWTATKLEARDLSSEFSFFVSRPISIQGTGTDGGMPQQDTVAISLRSVFGGRSRRGRLYHVGLGKGAQDGGYLTPTAMTLFVSSYGALLTAIESVQFAWGVVSYVENGAPRATPIFTGYSSVVITDNIVDSMDKRKPKP